MKRGCFVFVAAASTALLALAVVRASCARPDSAALRAKAAEARSYCVRHGMDTTFCILIDMGIHSGRERIFVWNFSEDKLKYSGLCCHGMGGGSTGAEPVFSNTPGSNCTSLGKYRVGARAWSNYGINVHYKLHGLESTNSNAHKRIVVLHSFTPVPDAEIYPAHLPMGFSLGCPVVSDALMRRLDGLLSAPAQPVLLWIYQ